MYEKYGVGTIHKTTKSGDIEIIEVLKNEKRLIRFLDGGFEKITNISSIRTGKVLCKEKEKYAVGTKHNTNQGYILEITAVVDRKYRELKFENYDYKFIRPIGDIKAKNIKNPYHPTVGGIGYLGVGKYKPSEGFVINKYYSIWHGMINRCINSDKLKYKTYKDTVICEEWYNFQNFAKWYEENYPKHIEGVNFELDKDLLQYGLKNKIYSPQTCIFLPKKVNIFLIESNINNSSGFSCVYLHKKANKFQVRLTEFLSGNNIYLGLYSDITIAKIAYNNERNNQIDIVKGYLKGLNYLPINILDIIDNIKVYNEDEVELV